MSTPTFAYTADVLRSLYDATSHLHRPIRKVLFTLGLWRPSYIQRWGSPALTTQPGHSSSPRPPIPSSPSRVGGIRFATWNIHSLGNMHVAVDDTVVASNLDILVITESWHRQSTDVALRRSVPSTYSSLDQPRIGSDDTIGGGLVIIHRDALRLLRIPLSSSPVTFEVLGASVSSLHGPLTLLAVYRPGSSTVTQAFFDEFTTLLEQFALYNTQIVIVGDLNFRLKDMSSSDASNFQVIADQFGLIPTHRGGGWFDVIITRDDCVPTHLCIHTPTISHH